MSNKDEFADTSYDVQEEGSRKGIGGVVFVGCLMLGFAGGLLLDDIALGVFMGLGIGFIAMALVRYATGHW